MKDFLEDYFWWLVLALTVLLLAYTAVGTSYKVDAIEQLAPAEIDKQGWVILHRDGWEYGAWGNDGGKVWYHVAEKTNPNIQYRIYVTKWGKQLNFTYGDPIPLQRIEIKQEEK